MRSCIRFLATATAAIGILAAGAVVADLTPASAAPAKVSSSTTNIQRVKLGLNKSVVIDLPSDAYDILVANPTVADAVTRTARRIYLFGKAVGETNIFVFGPNGEQIVSLDLAVERDVAGLEDYIKRFIPGADIKVELLNDNVVLTGTVDTPLDAKRAVDLATIFVTGGEATTGQYSQTATGGSENGGVDINNPDQTRQKSKIVNLLQIVGDDQVMLKVTVAEVSRNVMKQLGVNMLANGSTDGIKWGIDNAMPGGIGAPMVGGSGNFSLSRNGIGASISAMEQAGVLKTLAEPTLTAVSGEQATFRVGGEFNLLREVEPPKRDKDGVTDPGGLRYDQIEYGISLDFKPVVLSPGRISLKVRTAVSEPTNESPGLGGSNPMLPSLRKRLADTTVELPSGGSMMIAGLVRDDVKQVIGGVPGLSKVPILGTLFRSRDFIRNETELVIIVTPYLARPVARNELAKPDDNFSIASDGAGIFLGRVNRVYGTMKTDKPMGRYHGVVGFIYK
ncbi:type II and III secretion system protein family protein [Aminobacter aminovorans]|uniref:type II and III secretion system protein family protein n=1 Tax=Aminobacter aminovorans TaxID=83263 RepID=UPI00285B3C44|nr:type II and III secretion system protein family protein [Aminobacter aminovorans]MDR7220872.1 pilus assembly protein CpaC [Aminobacter aminovorans]